MIEQLSRENLREFFTCIDINDRIKDGFFFEPCLDAPGVLIIRAIARKCFLPSLRPKEEVPWFVKIACPQLDPVGTTPTFAGRLFQQAIRYISKARSFPESCSSFDRKWLQGY